MDEEKELRKEIMWYLLSRSELYRDGCGDLLRLAEVVYKWIEGKE